MVTGGFIAENLRSLMGRNSWIFEARAPGYEPASAKIVALFSTTARPAPPRRVLSKMAATKKRTPGFLAEEKLQRLQVGYNCVCGQVFHRKYKRILWPFMLAVSLKMFYRTTQKDTGKLKTFL